MWEGQLHLKLHKQLNVVIWKTVKRHEENVVLGSFALLAHVDKFGMQFTMNLPLIAPEKAFVCKNKNMLHLNHSLTMSLLTLWRPNRPKLARLGILLCLWESMGYKKVTLVYNKKICIWSKK